MHLRIATKEGVAKHPLSRFFPLRFAAHSHIHVLIWPKINPLTVVDFAWPILLILRRPDRRGCFTTASEAAPQKNPAAVS